MQSPIAVGHHRGGTQVIPQDVVYRAARGGVLAYCHPCTSGIVVGLHRRSRAGPLEIVADCYHCSAAHYAFHPVPVTIVDETRCNRPAGRNQAVLGVVGQVGGLIVAHFGQGNVVESVKFMNNSTDLLLLRY